MKRALFATLLLSAVVAGAVWFYFLPHVTIRHIMNSIERGDTVALSRDIDFPTLRDNLKEQARFLRMTAEMKGQRTNGPLVLDSLIDAFVTPYGLSQLRAKGDASHGTADYQFPIASYTYESASRFVATMAPLDPKENHGELKLVLARNGFAWRLNNILFTDAILAAISGATESPTPLPSASP